MDESSSSYSNGSIVIEKSREEVKEEKKQEEIKKEEVYFDKNSVRDISNEIHAEPESVIGDRQKSLIKTVGKNMPPFYGKEENEFNLGKIIAENYTAARISGTFNTLLSDIIGWEGHGTHKATSEPLIAAAKKMIRLRDEYQDYDPEEAQQLLRNLMDRAIIYLNKNAGYRFFKSGDRRKDTVRALIDEASDYAFKAGAGYVEQFGNAILTGDLGSSKSLADKKNGFRMKLSLETQEVDLADAVAILRAREESLDELPGYREIEEFDPAEVPEYKEEDLYRELGINQSIKAYDAASDPDIADIDRQIAEVRQKVAAGAVYDEKTAKAMEKAKKEAQEAQWIEDQIRKLEEELRRELEQKRELIKTAAASFTDLDLKKATHEEILASKDRMIMAISQISGYEGDRFVMLPADRLAGLLLGMNSDLEKEELMKTNLIDGLNKAREELDNDSLSERMSQLENAGETGLYREYAIYYYSMNVSVFRGLGQCPGKDELSALSSDKLYDFGESAALLGQVINGEECDVELLREAALKVLSLRTGCQISDFETLPFNELFDMAREVLASDTSQDGKALLERYQARRDEFTGADHTDQIRKLAHEVQCGNTEDAALLRELCIFELIKDSEVKRSDVSDMPALSLYMIWEDFQVHKQILTEEPGNDELNDNYVVGMEAERKQLLAKADKAAMDQNMHLAYIQQEIQKLEDAYKIYADGNYLDSDGRLKSKWFKPSADDIAKERKRTDDLISKVKEERITIETEEKTDSGKPKKVKMSRSEAVRYYGKIVTDSNVSAGRLAARIKGQKEMAALEKELNGSREKTWLRDRILRERETLGKSIDFSKIKKEQPQRFIWLRTGDDTAPWSEDASSALDLIGELVSGDEVYDTKGRVISGDKRLISILDSHSKVLLKMLEGHKNQKPEDPRWAGPLGELQSRITDDQRALISSIKDIFLDKILAKITDMAKGSPLDEKLLKSILGSKELGTYLAANEGLLGNAVNEGDRMLQNQLNTATEDMFGGVGSEIKDFWALHDMEYDPKKNEIRLLSKAEIEERRKEEKSLEKREKLAKIRDMVFDTKKGQGRFLDQVFKGYYQNASDSERRFMMSHVIKDIKPRRLHETGRQRGGKYFASMIKGAGPLMQKLFQGVPEQMLPAEFKSALSVVKSDLRPIPENYVDSKLKKIRDASEGKIASITKKRSLGAASIAETFLCDVEFTNGKKREVVVKLLRPDVKKRMEKEKAFILKCAQKTDADGVMEASFKAHLDKIQEELDFRNEAKNIQMGEVYEKKGLASVKLCEDIPAGADYLVMNKAEGTSLDRYMEETKGYGRDILNKYLNQDASREGRYALDRYQVEQYYKDRQALEKKLQEVETKYGHIKTMVSTWIEEALFGSRFHHGDLHAGNIMISDKEATVLDYGNATKLEKNKINNIVKMMAAAFFGDTKGYINGLKGILALDKGNSFNSLKKEEVNSLTERLETELTDIFRSGSKERTGEKIFVSLLKCQELGIKLPREIQNFSQCEQRLENTINEYRNMVNSLRTALWTMDAIRITPPGDYCLEPIAKANQDIALGYDTSAKKKSQQLVRDYMDPTEESVRADLEKMSPDEFDKTYMRDIINLKKGVEKDKKTFDKIRQYGKASREAVKKLKPFGTMTYEEIKASGRKKEYDENFGVMMEFSYDLMQLPDDSLDMFGGKVNVNTLLTDAFSNADEVKIEKFFAIFEKDIPEAIDMYDGLVKSRSIGNKNKKAAAQESLIKKYVEMKQAGIPDLAISKNFAMNMSPELYDIYRLPPSYETASSYVFNHQADFSWEKERQARSEFTEVVDAYKAALEEVEPYEEKIKQEIAFTPEEEKQYLALRKKVQREYQFFHVFTGGMQEKNQVFEKQNSVYFNDKAEGPALKAAFEERKRLQVIYIKKLYANAEDLPEIEKQRREAENKFLVIYRRLVHKHALIRNQYYKEAKSHNDYVDSFIGVMQGVLENQSFTLGKILGLKALDYKKQL